MSKKEEAKLWYQAWKATRQEDLVIKIKLDVDWLEMALAIGVVIWFWRGL